MRKLLILLSLMLLLLAPMALNASYVQCSTFVNNGSILNSTWLNATPSLEFGGNGSCEMGDKVFSNFVVGGNLPSSTTITLSEYGAGGTTFQIQFNPDVAGVFTNNFTISFDVTVDPAMSIGSPAKDAGFWRIMSVGEGMVDSGNPGTNASLTKTVTVTGGAGAGGTELLTQSPGGQTYNGPITGMSATSIHISESYVYTNGGGESAILDTIVQGDINGPEPATAGLLGIGLLGIGYLVRRRRGA